MHTHRSIRTVFLLLLTASPLLLPAQFKAPASDELTMKDDPKAPGAAAVFLNVEEITNDPLHFYSFYARVKILQEKGKALVTVQIPDRVGDSGVTSIKPGTMRQEWVDNSHALESTGKSAPSLPAAQSSFKIAEIKARTIHPDGTIVPLTLKPEELANLNAPRQPGHSIGFTLPAAEVGSILEYRYTLQYDENHFSSPFWEVQLPYFVHRAHYAFTPFNDFLSGDQAMTSRYLVDARGKVVNTIIWSPALPPGAAVKTDSIGNFSLDLSDIPPLPSEEWMPPAQSLAYHVRFYYKNAFNGSEFWTSEDNRWSKDVDRLAEPAAPIAQAVATLVAPGDSDLQKAAKLYTAIQALDNSDFHPSSRQAAPSAPRRASEVWAAKAGTSEEIALLYLAMLRAAGLSAYDMKVVDRDHGVFSQAYLSFDQFDADLIVLDFQGKEIFLDPGQKMCPFQTVHWKHAGASGIRQSAKGPVVATSPLSPYSANTLLRAGDISFDDPTHFTGLFRFVMTGQDALCWRQLLLTNSAEHVKELFDAWLQPTLAGGVQAHLDHFLAATDPGSNLIAIVNAQGAVENPSEGRYVLPGSFFAPLGASVFTRDAQRVEPIDMHFGDQVTDKIVYHLPAGLSVASVPAAGNASLDRYAAFASTSHSDSGQITTSCTLARAFTIAGLAEYPKLRDFYRQVTEAGRQQIVLTASSSTQGH